MNDPNALGGTLSLANISHRYAGVLALTDVSIEVASGAFVAILGPNGAGKSTLAQILCGVIHPSQGQVCVGGAAQRKPSRRAFVEQGIVLVPEGRRLFGQLSVRDNLLMGAYGARCKRSEVEERLSQTLEFMPAAVRDRQESAAAMLSGGEQQMLALGRAMMASPRTVVLDEPSLGLAPIMIGRMYQALDILNSQGVTVVVIEQMAAHAMRHAKSMTMLDRGHVVHSGQVADFETQELIKAGYFGAK